MNEVKDRTEWTAPELAAEIAEIIRLREWLWNQGAWFDGSARTIGHLRSLLTEDDNVCGSTGCVAGWATALTTPLGTKILSAGTVVLPDGQWEDAEDIGREALNISAADADWLFSAYREKEEVLTALDAIASGGAWSAPSCSCGEDGCTA